jgi:hypothetical protein
VLCWWGPLFRPFVLLMMCFAGVCAYSEAHHQTNRGRGYVNTIIFLSFITCLPYVALKHFSRLFHFLLTSFY